MPAHTLLPVIEGDSGAIYMVVPFDNVYTPPSGLRKKENRLLNVPYMYSD